MRPTESTRPSSKRGASSPMTRSLRPKRISEVMKCLNSSTSCSATVSPIDWDLPGPLQAQESCDQHGLDLGRARVQAASDRVAELPLHLELRGVPVPSVRLDRIERGLDGRLADKELGDRGLEHG